MKAFRIVQLTITRNRALAVNNEYVHTHTLAQNIHTICTHFCFVSAVGCSFPSAKGIKRELVVWFSWCRWELRERFWFLIIDGSGLPSEKCR